MYLVREIWKKYKRFFSKEKSHDVKKKCTFIPSGKDYFTSHVTLAPNISSGPCIVVCSLDSGLITGITVIAKQA